ncbi:molybdenum cofactor cytidylyltransferase [Proteiniborus ethanoligenes]|uniref:Molybdopterin molybdenumtransferase n=1 Tax=Proteiniborus ethanoligenes TaxID=415015 RepID=A0A1H3NH99_9FIRM|nr:molybdopterin-binding protein [Proteiniborus ethanoligenes]SDY88050.1 molybdenum cofactor cytidylyltransferase [Proteiniborus ethanoligenes]
MKKVKVEDAVGMVLAHDLTKIVPGQFKGAAYKKGHIIQLEDIDKLKDMGKNHINVIELTDNDIHEDDAAIRIGKAISGYKVYNTQPSEGKVTVKAEERGLLKINVKALELVNDIEFIIIAALHNNTVVEKDQAVVGTRIIPLTIEKERIEKIEEICKELGSIVSVKELKPLKAGIVVTGSEVYDGRIKDKFGPVLEEKVKHYGGLSIGVKYASDNSQMIEDTIKAFIEEGADVILTSGGMSVDADDVTPTAIKNISDRVITYGAPVLPGSMFMLAYKGDTPILGVPACGMYHKTTVLDLVLPRIMAGEVLNRKDITSLGHGGLCLNCPVCQYPVCPFGK